MANFRIPSQFGQQGAPAGGSLSIRFPDCSNVHWPVGPVLLAGNSFDIGEVFRDIGNASWSAIKRALVSTFGGPTFAVGAVYGAGESIVVSVVDLLQLMKTLALADLADATLVADQNSTWSAKLGQLIRPGGIGRSLVALVSQQFFADELKAAQAERNVLIEAIRYAVKNPGEVLGGIGQSYVDKWNKFEKLMAKSDLGSRFEAGKIFGEVLLEVLGLLAAGAGLAKLAAKIPGFARIATKFKGAVNGLKTRRAPKAKTSPPPPPPPPPSGKPKAPVADDAPPSKTQSPIESRKEANKKLRSSSQYELDKKKARVTDEQIALMEQKRVPLGFKNEAQFHQFKKEMSESLREAGLPDSQVGLKGTATTFYSENPSKRLGHYWDADLKNPGDYDLNISSPLLVEKMKAAGIQPSEKYGVFKTKDIQAQFPELNPFIEKWSQSLGRDVNFVGYPKPVTRDVTEFILKGGR